MRLRPIVIVGGGKVAARKVAGLLAAGASNVTVVSLEFNADMPVHESVRRVRERYHERHLDGASMVFAATDAREVNDTVVRDARLRGALVQRVDGHDDQLPGDFTTPAVHRDGPLVVAVSAGGNTPLSAMCRDRLAEHVDPIWPAMADALQKMRPIILKTVATDRRRECFHRAASLEAMEVFRHGGADELSAWLLKDI